MNCFSLEKTMLLPYDKSALPDKREVRSFYLGTMAKDSPSSLF